MRLSIFTALVLLLILPTSLWAQDNVVDLRLEVNEESKVTYANATYARNISAWMIVLSHVRLPEADDYEETVFGIGYNALTCNDIAFYGIANISAASDDNYFEPGIFVVDTAGKWTGSFWLVYYVPSSDKGITQILVDPIEVQYNLWRTISFGGSGYFWKPKNGPWTAKIGPKISIADKLGAIELRVAANSKGGTEFQLRRLFVF